MSATKYKTGLVLGKFMPLHRGHELLLHFARHAVDRLFVVVDWHDVIDNETRRRWVAETIPSAEVYVLDRPYPQAPEETPEFWNIWRRGLLDLLPQKPDVVIASENYGFRLAEELGAFFMPFDPARVTVPVSATMIRDDPYTNWHYLSAAVRLDYLARISIFGPESSGKSTLAAALAAHYKTVHVPEYARTYIEARGADLSLDDMPRIAQGQYALERAVAPAANRFLFCDTDPLATVIWTQWLFKSESQGINEIAARGQYPLTLLLESDLPWQADKVRYLEGQGDRFFADCASTLDRAKRPYKIIRGKGDARLQQAIAAVDAAIPELFSQK